MKIKLKTKKGYTDVETPYFRVDDCKNCKQGIFLIQGKKGEPFAISRAKNGDLLAHFVECPAKPKEEKTV